ncbi:MAG: uroporphyrinogen-III C-methyltransferase [Actinobacteria bacterium]|nr:uroporphyrinogen-III C-methyltransferase [Actinomycetota bacterium]MCL6094566.1 uroporphyrinogen-III C-methyltransferase [Actinomycetota bacterium]
MWKARVFLVGAGPGDPRLITVRAAELLRKADAVVYDRLVDKRVVDLAPSSAARFDVGKHPRKLLSPGEEPEVTNEAEGSFKGSIDQAAINELLIELASKHECVVRLKGGDPFVFGRGGEEALALLEAEVPFEVVPGITSAVAVPCYAGVPVTHRGISSSVTIVAGHLDSGGGQVKWEDIAKFSGTIVILMGVAHRAEIADRLMLGGLSGDTPVVAVSQGTLPCQRSIRTTLRYLGETELSSPATIVVGNVAELNFSWFERLPLFGWKVVVTRASEKASGIATMLEENGAMVLEVPVISKSPPRDGGDSLRRAVQRVGEYDWVVFTSPNSVDELFSAVSDLRQLGGVKIAAIGQGTEAALRNWHVSPDLIPPEAVAESLAAALIDSSGSIGQRALFPKAAGAREVLGNLLRQSGWYVDEVEAYRTEAGEVDTAMIEAVSKADAITFTSSSTVTNFVKLFGKEAVPSVVACIGPITAQTAVSEGLHVNVVASRHSVEGLVDSLVEYATGVSS